MSIINPTLPTVGQPNSTEDVDVLNALTTIVTAINGGLDTANLAAAAGILATQLEANARPATLLGAWRNLAEGRGYHDGGTVAGTYVLNGGNQPALSGASIPVFDKVPIVAADHAVSGLTAKLRSSVALACGLAPAVTFTFGLYPVTITSASGTLVVTLGTVVAGSTVAVASPAANSKTNAVSSEFSLPTDGIYALGVVVSGTVAAGSWSSWSHKIQVHHV